MQTKPVNYAGHFTASDTMVVSRTIMARIFRHRTVFQLQQRSCGQEHAAKLIPEAPGRDLTYLDRMKADLPEEGDVLTRDGQKVFLDKTE